MTTMVDIPALPDKRAPAYPDTPYSAYCRVCWTAAYILWIDEAALTGGCIFGCDHADTCPNARAAATNTAKLRKLKAAIAAEG